MSGFLQDLRYAVRQLHKSPGFAAVAVITLALGIGANTVIFSVVNSVLLRPLPFRDRDRLVMIWERKFPGDGKNNVVGPANFVRWQEQNKVFDQMAAVGYVPTMSAANISGDGEPERVPVAWVSPSLFPTMGVNAVLGRTFTPDEGPDGHDSVALLEYGFWKRRFGGNPNVVGRSLTINGQPTTVVGVLPDWFAFPQGAEVFSPMAFSSHARDFRGRYLMVVGHLASGVTVAQAQAGMDVIAKRLQQELPDFDTGWAIHVVPLREQLIGGIRTALLLLLGAVGFVLFIACANVANLLLARSASRVQEIAVRVALGVTRARLVRQLLTESVLLGVVGGAVGVGMAYWGLSGVLAILPSDLPTFTPVGIHPAVLLYTFLISVGTGTLFGVAPAFQALRGNQVEALKEGGRTAAGGRGRHRLRNVLVGGEAALTLLLLIGAGLLIKSFVRLLTVDPGFEPSHVLTMRVSLPRSKYAHEPQQTAFFQQTIARFQSLPGVERAGAVSFLPLDGLGSATTFTIDDFPKPAAGDEPVADVLSVTKDYFTTIGVPLLRGRFFGDADRPDDAVKKVVINQAMANLFAPGIDPVGRSISMDWGSPMRGQIVGVVKDVKLAALEDTPRAQIYWFMPQFQMEFMSFVIRTSGDPKTLAKAARAQISALDPDLPVAKIRTMDEVMGASVKQPRFTMLLLGSFAGLALLLAAVGIYGVISCSVTQRRHELGVRMALGADAADVLRMVVREGMGVALIGMAVGLVIAFAVARFLASFLFAVKTTDLSVFAGVAGLLAAVALVAAYIPARRAASVDPMVALRYE